jgi:deoxyribodipyrimidine photo-lyase
MASTALVWFRRDLRLHDHPPLASALRDHDRVVPVFVLDPALLAGRFGAGPRTWFLLGCLDVLDAALRERGGRLVVRHGHPATALPLLAAEVGARACHWAADVSPYAAGRDRRVRAALELAGVAPVPGPGNFVTDVGATRSRAGTPFVVFSPFHRAWQRAERRTVHRAPAVVPVPRGVGSDGVPGPADLGPAEPAVEPGEEAARRRLESWLDGPVSRYDEKRNLLTGDTSMLSPYLHFGCLSPREVEARAVRRHGPGPAAFTRQLAWRDFYAHVLLHHPGNAHQEFQPRYRGMEWDDDAELLAAWREGRTGYPLVDAGMRQLAATGWMHNRARLVVGSFLTKDLHLDWRAGEAWFMDRLLDGDMASNNGNWQWIASTGVDPAPLFRRLYNPARHQERYDPRGDYVRRWVPELGRVPDRALAEPWRMSDEDQKASGCVLGPAGGPMGSRERMGGRAFHYPEPVVDHARERERALARYRAAAP